MPQIATSTLPTEGLAPWVRSSLVEAIEVLRRRGLNHTADSLYRLSEIVSAAHIDTFRNAETEEILEYLYCAVYDEDINHVLRMICDSFGIGHCAVFEFFQGAEGIRCGNIVSTWSVRWTAEYIINKYYNEDPYVKNATKSELFINKDEGAIVSEAEGRILERAKLHNIGYYGVSVYVETGEDQFSVVSMRSCSGEKGGITHIDAYVDDLMCIATNLALSLAQIARVQKQWRK